jgi:subtilisin family serine protease
MANLDFRLRHLYQKVASMRLHILLQFKNDLAAVERVGFQVTSRAGDVVAGSIPFDRLDELTNHPEVVLIEGSRQLKDEVDVSAVASNLIDAKTEERLIPSFGKGAIIGVIESGFDLTHPCFCDEQGRTRVLAAWDQVNLEKAAGKPPGKFGYGIEYTQDAINQQILEQKILAIRNHPLSGGHGTVVAGVAAGNGFPEKVFTGIAHEAELIFVSYNNDRPIGGSAFLLDAIRYITGRARCYGKPVVINLSQGDNLGAHDGTSLLERAIDYIAAQEGVLIVNSAGNESNGLRHARGQVEPGEKHELLFELKQTGTNVVSGDTIDLWYQGGDHLGVTIRNPDGWESPSIKPDAEEVITFPDGTQAYVCAQTDYPANHANRVSLVLDEGKPWKNGIWKLVLHGQEVKQRVQFDAWADCPHDLSVITFPEEASDVCTVTLPGTAAQIFTVGSFVSRAAKGLAADSPKGSIGPLSGRGPTLNGHTKPDLAAPGFFIMAPGTRKAISGPNASNYQFRSGTSLSAPHVTGIAALFLALNPALTAGQIADALRLTAGHDKFTNDVPNPTWGAGKLNAGAAYKALFTSPQKEDKTVGERTQEMKLNVPHKDGKEFSELTVRFVFDESGSIVRIEGTGPQHSYVGKLTLKGTALGLEKSSSEAAGLEAAGSKESGDHCVVCEPGKACFVQVPCTSCE